MEIMLTHQCNANMNGEQRIKKEKRNNYFQRKSEWRSDWEEGDNPDCKAWQNKQIMNEKRNEDQIHKKQDSRLKINKANPNRGRISGRRKNGDSSFWLHKNPSQTQKELFFPRKRKAQYSPLSLSLSLSLV